MTSSISEEKLTPDNFTLISDTITNGLGTDSQTSSEKSREELEKLGEGLPKIFISTPWSLPYISSGFATCLRNMFVPFPHTYEQVKARFLADARNALVAHAIEAGFDYVMQIDADQYFPPNFFIHLWEGIKQYGDDAVITGWSICKAGKFAKQPSVYRVSGNDLVAISATELLHREQFIEVDAFGTCGFLASTKLLSKLTPPWFADINLIRDDLRVDEFLTATEFVMGQDLAFATRVKQAGGRVICATKMRMPHEEVVTL